MKELKFCVFADLHYKKGMYPATVKDVDIILKRAKDSNVDFVLHCGDLCNDYKASPELVKAVLDNKYGLPVYGCYGNHELEFEAAMENVTPYLTNREVMWGSKDGKTGDGSIGYYCFDYEGFRIVVTDTNYSYNTSKKQWEHNLPNSHFKPEENISGDSLGGVQLKWLENVLTEAAYKGYKCIVTGHAGFSGLCDQSPDAGAVRAIYRKVNAIKPKTVIMSLNGHYHTNHIVVSGDVIYFDVNTALNGFWGPGTGGAYSENASFSYSEHDENGNVTKSYDRTYKSLWMTEDMHYFNSPLSAIVSIGEGIEISGAETSWVEGIEPQTDVSGCEPKISSLRIN